MSTQIKTEYGLVDIHECRGERIGLLPKLMLLCGILVFLFYFRLIYTTLGIVGAIPVGILILAALGLILYNPGDYYLIFLGEHGQCVTKTNNSDADNKAIAEAVTKMKLRVRREQERKAELIEAINGV